MISKQLIQNKAFNIFKDWTKKALIERPELNLIIKDETALVDSLMESIQNGNMNTY